MTSTITLTQTEQPLMLALRVSPAQSLTEKIQSLLDKLRSIYRREEIAACAVKLFSLAENNLVISRAVLKSIDQWTAEERNEVSFDLCELRNRLIAASIAEPSANDDRQLQLLSIYDLIDGILTCTVLNGTAQEFIQQYEKCSAEVDEPTALAFLSRLKEVDVLSQQREEQIRKEYADAIHRLRSSHQSRREEIGRQQAAFTATMHAKNRAADALKNRVDQSVQHLTTLATNFEEVTNRLNSTASQTAQVLANSKFNTEK